MHFFPIKRLICDCWPGDGDQSGTYSRRNWRLFNARFVAPLERDTRGGPAGEARPSIRRQQSSAGVGNTAVSELHAGESGIVLAPLVNVAAVGQLHLGLFSSFVLLDVLVATIKKGCHWLFLEEIQVPVPWPGLSALRRDEVNV